MRLPDPFRKLETKDTPNIWQSLNRIRISLGLSHHELAEMLELTSGEYLRSFKARKNLRAPSAMRLAHRLHITFDAIVTDTLDYKALVEHYHGHAEYLPECYSKNAFSKQRTIINILNFIEERYGWYRRAALLRQFQVNEATFKDPDALINMKLSVDLCNQLYRMNRDESTLFQMGLNSAYTNLTSPIGQVMSKTQTQKEAYEQMLSGIIPKFIENNFAWKMIELDDKHCEVEGQPTPELWETIEPTYVMSKSACLVRQGTAASVPLYIGYPAAKLTETACIAFGDNACRFNLQFKTAIQTPSYNLSCDL